MAEIRHLENREIANEKSMKFGAQIQICNSVTVTWPNMKIVKKLKMAHSCNINKCVSKTHIDKRGRALKTMCNTPAPFSRTTSPSLIVCLYLAYSKLLQELSYRKQIARQLRTQYI